MRQKPMAAAPVSLVQNLEDAGCGPELVKEFLALKETGDVNGQMRLLRIHNEKQKYIFRSKWMTGM